MSQTELGTFLTARRGHVVPGDVGLIASSGRRVSGLRREEVAMLSGVSVDYYSRLEQGRETHPSPAVLNAIAGALTMDADLREHAFRLADLAPVRLQPGAETVDRSLMNLLASWAHTPAIIINRQLDILSRNDLAASLHSDFAKADNIVRMTFTDPAGRHFFIDWPRAAETCVANLRLALGHASNHEAVTALVAEMHEASADFRRLWAKHNVRGKSHEAKAFRHTSVGDMLLDYNAFDVRSSPGQQLVVYQAAAGTASSDKLRLLGTLASTVAFGVSKPGPAR